MGTFKPQLADNWLEAKQRLPAWQQPKWDGVRGLHIAGQFTGRSLKPFKNKALTAFWSQPIFSWLDGELVIPGAVENTPRLCSLTTGMCNRVDETQVPDLIVFDYLRPDLIEKGATYRDRMDLLHDSIIPMLHGFHDSTKVRLIETHEVETMEAVLALDEEFLDRGLEGSILRNADAAYKEGRPSSKVQELMRIKRFIDFEFLVEELVEAMENRNEAKVNELGRTERSTHKENLVPKGMVGALRGRMASDVVHNGKVLFAAGHSVIAGPGQMTHPERTDYWHHPEKIIGQIVKAKFFPQGLKDTVRMPVFLSLRAEEDMS